MGWPDRRIAGRVAVQQLPLAVIEGTQAMPRPVQGPQTGPDRLRRETPQGQPPEIDFAMSATAAIVANGSGLATIVSRPANSPFRLRLQGPDPPHAAGRRAPAWDR